MKNTLQLKWLLMLIGISFFNILTAQTDLNISTNFQGRSRSFRVHIPPGYAPDNPIPVVFVFHGGGTSNSSEIQIRTKFHLIGDTAKFITIFPQALLNSWADSRMTAADIAGIDDVSFTSYIIDTLKMIYNIDTTRIYAAGLSTGGVFCQRLALQLNSRIAAFASVGASLYTSLLSLSDYPPSRKISMLYILGTSDIYNRYYGGVGLAKGPGLTEFVAIHADSAATKWASFDNCFPYPTIYQFPDVNTSDVSTVTRFTYSPCQYGSEILLYRINNGGHTWPGVNNPTALGNVNLDINGSQEIWSFFRRHRLLCPEGGDPVDTDGDLDPDFCDTCPLDAKNDIDGDGVCGNIDNCPTQANSDQEDMDADDKGDACDAVVNFGDACDNLIDIIQSLGLPNGLENAMSVKIRASMESCTNRNKNAVINQLNAFINFVNAKRGNGLNNVQANQLIAFAQKLINAIQNTTADCGS